MAKSYQLLGFSHFWNDGPFKFYSFQFCKRQSLTKSKSSRSRTFPKSVTQPRCQKFRRQKSSKKIRRDDRPAPPNERFQSSRKTKLRWNEWSKTFTETCRRRLSIRDSRNLRVEIRTRIRHLLHLQQRLRRQRGRPNMELWLRKFPTGKINFLSIFSFTFSQL